MCRSLYVYMQRHKEETNDDAGLKTNSDDFKIISFLKDENVIQVLMSC